MSRLFTRSAGTDYINLGDITAARFEELEAWTLLVFFRQTTSDAAEESRIVAKTNNPSSQRQFFVGINNGTTPQEIEVYINAIEVITGPDVIALNTWYLMAITNDGTGGAGGFKLYLATMDGLFEASYNPATGTHGGDSGTLTSPIWIGARNVSVRDYFDGDIAHVVYLNSEFTSDQILAYLRKPKQIAVNAGAGCIFYLPLGYGSPEPDWSGNQNDGTINGTPSISEMPPIVPYRYWPTALEAAAAAVRRIFITHT